MGKGSASHQPTKSFKEQTRTCPGQAQFESYLYLYQGKARNLFKFLLKSAFKREKIKGKTLKTGDQFH